MAFKSISFLTLLAIAFAVPEHYHNYYEHESLNSKMIEKNPIAVYKKDIEHEAPVYYDFSYDVHDGHTKDIKSQKESRRGDMVKGYYDMIDSDGYKRIVDYTADDKNGFQASVHREKSKIAVPIPISRNIQDSYHNANYGKQSLHHHNIPHPVHYKAHYDQHSLHHHNMPHPVHYAANYDKHSLHHHNMPHPVQNIENYDEQSLHHHNMPHPTHYAVNYDKHSLYHHNMPHLVHSDASCEENSLNHHNMANPAEHYSPASHKSYSVVKNPVVALKHVAPIAKYFGKVDDSGQKYIVPAVHKIPVVTPAPVDTSMVHYVTKSRAPINQVSNHHVDTHVSFHGVHAKYEY